MENIFNDIIDLHIIFLRVLYSFINRYKSYILFLLNMSFGLVFHIFLVFLFFNNIFSYNDK